MSEDANFVYTEVPVSGEIQSAQRATPDELVRMANRIWQEVKKAKVPKTDHKGNDELLERLQDKYKDFQTSFPVVLRWMVQRREYNGDAFRLYLHKHATAKMGKREEFLELQADYIIILYRKTHPHANEDFIRRYREEVNRYLLAEDKTFIEVTEEVEKDVAAKSAEYDRDRRKRLYETLMAAKAAKTAKIAEIGTAALSETVSAATSVNS